MGHTSWTPWLPLLLEEPFFVACKTHNSNSSRCECNMYCLDCNNGALCSFCLQYHGDHRVIQVTRLMHVLLHNADNLTTNWSVGEGMFQIRRSSYHDVIRVSEIQKHLDISGVQTYVINGARIVFLNERPQLRVGKVSAYMCSNCNRSLLDAFEFCSLGCKMEKTAPVEVARRSIGGIRSRLDCISMPEEQERMVGNSVKKRRKGIPHRAPMGGWW